MQKWYSGRDIPCLSEYCPYKAHSAYRCHKKHRIELHVLNSLPQTSIGDMYPFARPTLPTELQIHLQILAHRLQSVTIITSARTYYVRVSIIHSAQRIAYKRDDESLSE